MISEIIYKRLLSLMLALLIGFTPWTSQQMSFSSEEASQGSASDVLEKLLDGVRSENESAKKVISELEAAIDDAQDGRIRNFLADEGVSVVAAVLLVFMFTKNGRGLNWQWKAIGVITSVTSLAGGLRAVFLKLDQINFLKNEIQMAKEVLASKQEALETLEEWVSSGSPSEEAILASLSSLKDEKSLSLNRKEQKLADLESDLAEAKEAQPASKLISISSQTVSKLFVVLTVYAAGRFLYKFKTANHFPPVMGAGIVTVGALVGTIFTAIPGNRINSLSSEKVEAIEEVIRIAREDIETEKEELEKLELVITP